ncbi:FIG056333: sensor [hydrothermal vent metagenome]|uniref:histidine kinase n=1 Tax=hydrothermal vent metagenome TaxID=652676 RepID=A0A3B0SCZ5_9ZZZZ
MGIGATKKPGHIAFVRSVHVAFCSALGSALLPTSAMAGTDLLSKENFQTFSFAALVLAIVVFVWALRVVRKLSFSETTTRQKLKDVEGRLNEAEAIMDAEPGILIVWRGRGDVPQTITGDMYDAVKIPSQQDQLLDFSLWLTSESAETLRDNLEALRDSGKAFNIGIRTANGELLEADGRTAGGTATLRFRPLVGERRSNADLSHETRRLGKQVQRLSAILDQAPFPIWFDNKEGELAWINQAYMSAVEATNVERVLQQPVLLVDEAKIVAPNATSKTNSALRGTVDVIISGNRRSMDIFKVSSETEDANFAIDMTNLDTAQKELELHIKAHASTLDKLATAIAIFGPDQHLRFYNSAYAKLWGLDPDWLDAHPGDSEILDKLRSERNLPEQANYRAWKTELLTAYKTLDAKEYWWHLPDGQSLRVIAEQHPFGGVTYLYENVTEQISLESRYNALIDIQSDTLSNLEEGIALFGTDGKLQLHNVSFAKFWNLSQEFLITKPHIDDVINKCRVLFDDSGIWDDLKYCVTSINDKRKPLQDRITRPDKTIFDCAAIPLPGGNTLVTYLDVSDSAGIERALRERNEALEAADRLKTNFLSNVSYELRTPLTNILGFAEGLSMGIAGELQDKQKEYLGHIQSSSDDLLVIIDAILDLTAIDAGALDLKLSEISVAEILEKTARSMTAKIRQMDLTLNIEIAENISSFIGDEQRLTQIFGNLLANAIGFSPEKGIVRLGAKRDGDDIVIWVADTGRGMEPEFQKQAFERFQSKPISGGHRGPGLGLAIVKSFVELHEGQVSLLSKLGKGTTVICRFPIVGPIARTISSTGVGQIQIPDNKRALAG